MTDNEIIKALGCCCEDTYCDGCPYKNKDECITSLNADAINLINHQKAEVERLQKENHRFANIGKMYSEIKSEARKELADRLKEELDDFYYSGEDSILCTLWMIDDALKELENENG